MSNFACTLCLLALPTESLGYSTLKGAPLKAWFIFVSITYRNKKLLKAMGVPPYLQPMFVSRIHTITWLNYTYEFLILVAGYVF